MDELNKIFQFEKVGSSYRFHGVAGEFFDVDFTSGAGTVNAEGDPIRVALQVKRGRKPIAENGPIVVTYDRNLSIRFAWFKRPWLPSSVGPMEIMDIYPLSR